MVSPATETLTHVAIPQPRPTAVERQEKKLPNVGEIERVVSIFVGSLLLTKGVRRFSLSGAATAFAGWRMINRGVTGQCSLYKALHVSTRQPDEGMLGSKAFTHPLHQHIRVEKTITINKPIEQVFSFWRNLENLPRFMDHLESVQVLDDKRSHWKAKEPPAARRSSGMPRLSKRRPTKKLRGNRPRIPRCPTPVRSFSPKAPKVEAPR